MPRGIPHTTYRRHPLPKGLQKRFDEYVTRVGTLPASEALGVGWATIEKLRYGGSAAPESVARVATRLEEVTRDAR